jgi:hypothetical protein
LGPTHFIVAHGPPHGPRLPPLYASATSALPTDWKKPGSTDTWVVKSVVAPHSRMNMTARCFPSGDGRIAIVSLLHSGLLHAPATRVRGRANDKLRIVASYSPLASRQCPLSTHKGRSLGICARATAMRLRVESGRRAQQHFSYQTAPRAWDSDARAPLGFR